MKLYLFALGSHYGFQGNDISGKLENACTRQQTPQKDSYGKERACNNQNKKKSAESTFH